MSELPDALDDPEVDLDVEPFPRASLEGERRSGNLGLGSCQSVRSKHPMFSSVTAPAVMNQKLNSPIPLARVGVFTIEADSLPLESAPLLLRRMTGHRLLTIDGGLFHATWLPVG